MSTRDEAGLTEREKEILARIAASATSEDPRLAAALRPERWRRLAQLPTPATHPLVGLALAVAGFALMMLAVAAGAPLVAGLPAVVLTFAGAGQLGATWNRWGGRWLGSRASAPD